MNKPVDVLQGTLDLFNLKALSLGRGMDMACCCGSSRFRETGWKFNESLGTPHYTDWSARNGSQANGANRKTSGKQNTTDSRQR